MKLSPPQQTIADSPARFRVAICGRRFGKTYLAMNEVAKVARQPDRRVFFVYPTYRMARTIMWDPMKTRLRSLRWLARANETDMTMTLVNNSRISLRGADNPDSLRGVGLDFVCMDEFAMCEEKAWTEVLRPTLSDRAGSALFISTPLGTSNWAYDLFQRGRDPGESAWESFSYTTIDGGQVPESEIEQARRDLDARTFEQEYLASFVQYRNQIFYAFDRAHNVSPAPGPIGLNLHIGLDFNVGQMTAAVAEEIGDRVYIREEIALHSSNTQEIVAEIQSRYPRARITVYPDPAGAARKTSAGSGVTDHTILQNAQFIVRAPRAHTPVRDGINAVNSLLCSAQGQRRLFIDPGCTRLIAALEKHCYKEDSNQPDKESGYDHWTDALRYYVDFRFPVRADRLPSPPQRWGVQVRH